MFQNVIIFNVIGLISICPDDVSEPFILHLWYVHFKYRQENVYSFNQTYSALVSGVGRSPIVVRVSVDQYKEPKYFLVRVA